MAAVKNKKKISKRSDSMKVVVSLPGEIYYEVKKFAEEDIRTIPQQVRYFMEIGMQVVAQQMEMSEACTHEPEEEEKAPAIGFQVSRDDDEDDD